MLDTQPRPTIRTLVASFLFTDLVGFSKGTASDQYAAKAKLSGVLRRHLQPLKDEDYWIKDTGDGALIAFVSNPEHALYMALALGEEYAGGAAQTSSGSLRTGLHLGTVKESIDVEARRNFIGDGINAAKRIMDFALPGQITASRAFFEAIANLDAAYAALFAHVGAADDKHGRAHDLYTVSPSTSVLDRMREDLAAARTVEPSMPASSPASRSDTGSGAGRLKRPLAIAAVIVVVAAIAVAVRLREPSTGAPSTPATSAQPSISAPSTPATSAQPSISAPSAPAASPRPSSEAPPIATKAPDVAPPSTTETRASAPAPMPPASNVAAPAADAASPPALPQEEVSRRDTEPRRAAAPPPPRAASETRPRAAAPLAASESKPAASASPRCTRIVEKAALGEPLTAEEKRELASCR